ncbi:gluconate:H+ symporter [Corynebacterium caspium]|uniref:GntT/GntP/DsdX family permease n=1 Tax=Corynebacterium caspium TaxID=234828 RepID=UPI00035E4751|nr:gluconate:H+ symporter [Corynebacterium caspium]WKD58640.1 DsdX permease [Corynebacterium caspium DSM 44850]
MVTTTGGLVAVLLAAIVLIVILIVGLKLHGSIALSIAAIITAVATGVRPGDIGDLLEEGVGGTLGFLVLVIGFGSILGKMLEVSGGAERLAQSMLRAFGKDRAPVVMTFLGLIAGIPVFVEVGLVLLVPLVFVVAKEVGCSRMRVGLPLAISLMTVHCILPPHPAATAIAGTLGADIGTVILLGLLVGIPASLIGGTVYSVLAVRKQQDAILETEQVLVTAGGAGNTPSLSSGSTDAETDTPPVVLPSFAITLFTIMLPLLIMVGRTITDMVLPEESGFRELMSLVGHPIIALLISVLFAYWSLGLARGMNLNRLSDISGNAFDPIGGVLLIIGAGGAFNAVLKASGIAEALATQLGGLPLSPIVMAWLIALLLHFAVGSATVAMISAAGIVFPFLAANPDMSPAVLALAVGAGAIGLTHVTDSLFWMYKEFMGISVVTALKTLTVGTTIASVVALGITLLLNLIL